MREFGLGVADWPTVTECTKAILNSASLNCLETRKNSPGVYLSPFEVFMGTKTSLSRLRELSIENHMSLPRIDEIWARQLMNIHRTQNALESIHLDVAKVVSKQRQQALQSRNMCTNVVTAVFDISDLVLMRKATEHDHKLQFRWQRLKRIIASESK